MNSVQPQADAPGAEFLKSLDKKQLGAGLSKLVSASVGDIAMVFSRSPAHKYFSLADIEWVILPAVVNGQFYVVESVNEETGFRAPVAVATWAFVCEEADHRLQSNLTQHARLRPDEWRGGEIGWIVDLVGDLRGTQAAAEWLRAGLFKERDAKIVLTDETSTKRLSSLHVVTRKSRGHE